MLCVVTAMVHYAVAWGFLARNLAVLAGSFAFAIIVYFGARHEDIEWCKAHPSQSPQYLNLPVLIPSIENIGRLWGID